MLSTTIHGVAVVLKKLFCLIISINLCACCMNKTEKLTTIANSQDIYSYISQNLVINNREQQKLVTNYFTHYFSPWHKHHFFESLNEIKLDCKKEIIRLNKHPGFGANFQPCSHEWIEKIDKNSNLQHFPNLMRPAITISDVNSREVPTSEPNYQVLPSPEKVAPFDGNQQSLISANTPVFVLHSSRDGAWYLVITSSYFAWVPKDAIAFVDSDFKKQWQSSKFVTPLKDSVSIFDEHKNYLIMTRIGEIYPVYKATRDYYYVLIATTDIQQKAIIKIGKLSKKVAHVFPEKLMTENVANFANAMLGKPYGWGGMFGYRDCSSTMMDLFAPFGIWLPRNSIDQVKVPSSISLKNLTNEAKTEIIKNQGVPFFTLLHSPGHVMLYLGEHQNLLYVFHDTWGELHTNNGYEDQVNIIGRTVITSTLLKRTKDETLIDQIDAMRVLVDY